MAALHREHRCFGCGGSCSVLTGFHLHKQGELKHGSAPLQLRIVIYNVWVLPCLVQLEAHYSRSLSAHSANGELRNKAKKKKNPFCRLPKAADSVRYLGEEGPRWAASSTAASEQCWLDREELRLVSAGLERPDELGYQRFACWSLIACEINRT